MSEIIQAAEELLKSLTFDNGEGGGLISRETIRRADELRILVLRWKRAQGLD